MAGMDARRHDHHHSDAAPWTELELPLCVSSACRRPDCRYFGPERTWLRAELSHSTCPNCGQDYERGAEHVWRPSSSGCEESQCLPYHKVVTVLDVATQTFFALPVDWPSPASAQCLLMDAIRIADDFHGPVPGKMKSFEESAKDLTRMLEWFRASPLVATRTAARNGDKGRLGHGDDAHATGTTGISETYAHCHCFPVGADGRILLQRDELDELVTVYGCLIRARGMRVQDLRRETEPVDVQVCYMSGNLAAMVRVDPCCTVRDLKIAIRAQHAIPFFQQRILQMGEIEEPDDDLIMGCRHVTLLRESDVVKGVYAYVCRSWLCRRDYLAPNEPRGLRGSSRVWSLVNYVAQAAMEDPSLDIDDFKRLSGMLVEAYPFAGFEE